MLNETWHVDLQKSQGNHHVINIEQQNEDALLSTFRGEGEEVTNVQNKKRKKYRKRRGRRQIQEKIKDL